MIASKSAFFDHKTRIISKIPSAIVLKVPKNESAVNFHPPDPLAYFNLRKTAPKRGKLALIDQVGVVRFAGEIPTNLQNFTKVVLESEKSCDRINSHISLS